MKEQGGKPLSSFITTLSGGEIALHYTRDEWLISFESLKILLLNTLKPFQLKCKFLNKISVKQNAKKPLI